MAIMRPRSPNVCATLRSSRTNCPLTRASASSPTRPNPARRPSGPWTNSLAGRPRVRGCQRAKLRRRCAAPRDAGSLRRHSLMISGRTAEGCVANILNKLGVDRRAPVTGPGGTLRLNGACGDGARREGQFCRIRADFVDQAWRSAGREIVVIVLRTRLKLARRPSMGAPRRAGPSAWRSEIRSDLLSRRIRRCWGCDPITESSYWQFRAEWRAPAESCDT